ncbi:DUF3307 domain-containing protein [Eggerthella lenta]|jgi:hypothetical protein|uniref:DUF3307 domain-containing protein n=2 Tax=Eggerthella lenta TaxID=84112 RepID=C8WK84_EGGLE|nr:DUF3307 domain-containing protein [Eggerthella lenta]ACV56241.1 conserved hypothetical protein [Eggerthella lenta DSM 2243]
MTLGFALVLVLTGHVIADFYLQTNRVARGKGESGTLLALHCGYYALCMALFVSLTLPLDSIVPVWLALSLSHALIDFGKARLEKRAGSSLVVFVIDQTLHILLCAAVVAAFCGGSPAIGVVGVLAGVMSPPSAATALATGLVLLIIWRPGAIFVRLLLESVRIEGADAMHDGESTVEELRAGRWIGMLERTIISVLALCGQFGAIAFVLTAKSIARFKMLDDKEFAECYLVGTLASTALAILVSLTILEVVAWS